MALHERLRRLDDYRELSGFKTEPAQMRAAGPGKIGELRLGFTRRGDRSVLSDLYRVAPLLVQQALYWDEAMPELPICAIISVGGGILQGDRYTIDISVGEGACAQVTSQGANRIHQMDANYASQHQEVVVGADAYLEYLPDVTIPYRDSRFINDTDLIVDESATVIYGEMMMTGRKHHHASERFGLDLLSMSVNVRRPDGRKLFTEKVLIEKGNNTGDFAAVMRGFDAFANIMCLTPPETAERIKARMDTNWPDENPRAISGVSALPNGAGLMLRAVGIESYDVRREVRRFWKVVREEARGRTLPEEFLWR
ncbi:urease accessory protein UreD [Nitratireductor aquimarinus]|uniref:Urease accessory protein UreD n=1 Tax=Nitratireductor aquimarinus TaxID=889300 RepID=A0ABU4AP82_9HYPH|nr:MULTISPECIES: urease accessory protein UreD [Nitratireductor]MBN7775848.1 urease accessory protein UreD [Nitratireductor pacificus]MBN7780511.1 urease accessory protein UreD [Nitratireductor pacificus]MBN7789318.1 urease accessory protein UreD [Nitratireductor aquimarinus]MBN8242461.1 urease accessory protein UreD [Nitratireductor aquimarinus]MBY6098595.1 urease accessory protein UreD [Nitratireductor aquimarinus]